MNAVTNSIINGKEDPIDVQIFDVENLLMLFGLKSV